jgi:hypothetical protein
MHFAVHWSCTTGKSIRSRVLTDEPFNIFSVLMFDFEDTWITAPVWHSFNLSGGWEHSNGTVSRRPLGGCGEE